MILHNWYRTAVHCEPHGLSFLRIDRTYVGVASCKVDSDRVRGGWQVGAVTVSCMDSPQPSTHADASVPLRTKHTSRMEVMPCGLQCGMLLWLRERGNGQSTIPPRP